MRLTDVYSIVYNLKKKLQDVNISKNDKTFHLNLTLSSGAKLKTPEHYTSNKKEINLYQMIFVLW